VASFVVAHQAAGTTNVEAPNSGWSVRPISPGQLVEIENCKRLSL
jgi:hypothetical protein